MAVTATIIVAPEMVASSSAPKGLIEGIEKSANLSRAARNK